MLSRHLIQAQIIYDESQELLVRLGPQLFQLREEFWQPSSPNKVKIKIDISFA
jgi:hypothetical protein